MAVGVDRLKKVTGAEINSQYMKKRKPSMDKRSINFYFYIPGAIFSIAH